MNELGMTVLLLCILLQSTPIYSFVQTANEHYELTQVKELSLHEMQNISGGTGGGGGNSNSGGISNHRPKPVTNKKISGIPYYYQNVSTWQMSNKIINNEYVSERSKYYCGISCVSMISAWKQPHQNWMNSRESIEEHFIEIDNLACRGWFMKKIDVYQNHGFLYMGNDSNSLKMDYSKYAIKDLYNQYGGRGCYIRPEEYNSPDRAFDNLWDNVEDNNEPGLIVTHGTNNSLHYILCTGIYKKNNIRSFYINNPSRKNNGGGLHVILEEGKAKKIMKIENRYPNNFGWVGDYQRGNAIYGLIN